MKAAIFTILSLAYMACAPGHSSPPPTSAAPTECIAAPVTSQPISSELAAGSGRCPEAEDVRTAYPIYLDDQPQGEPLEMFVLVHEVVPGRLLDRVVHDLKLSRYDDKTVAVSPAQIRRWGLHLDERPLWLLSEDAPCRLSLRGHPLIRWETGGPAGMVLMQEVTGECSDKLRGQKIVAQQWTAPANCRRVSEPTAQKGDKAVALAPFAAHKLFAEALESQACQPPTCRFKYQQTHTLGPNGFSVDDLIVTWIYPTKQSECSWKYKNWHGLFLRDASGMREWKHANAAEQISGQVTLLMDSGSDYSAVRLILLSEGGTLEVYEPPTAGAQPTLLRKFQYALFHEEDFPFYSLAPYCGP